AHFVILALAANAATRKWCAGIEPWAKKPRREVRMYSDQNTVKLRADWIRVQAPIATASNGDNPSSIDRENRCKLGGPNVPRGTLGGAKSGGGVQSTVNKR